MAINNYPSLLRSGARLVLIVGILYACQPVTDSDPKPAVAPNPLSGQTTMLSITDRQTVVNAYNQEFIGTPLMNWSGDVNECREGTTSTAFVATQLSRINYYRAMAGVEGKVRFVDSLNRKAQKAVLMLGVAGILTHKALKSWKCYSSDGDWAVTNSNLAQTGGTNPDFITQYIADYGANNTDVGHRRWLLSPAVTVMGTGNMLHPKSKIAYNALPMALDAFSTDRVLTRNEYVCWPVPGYTPYQLVFPRWSFHLPGADFSDSSVSVMKGGKVMVATVVSDDDTDYGDNALIWEMDAMTKPTADQVYEVTVQNVRKGGQTRSFTYTVTVIDPVTKP
jgi:hypothetical protein